MSQPTDDEVICAYVRSLSDQELDWMLTNSSYGLAIGEHLDSCSGCASRVQRVLSNPDSAATTTKTTFQRFVEVSQELASGEDLCNRVLGTL